MSKVTIVASDGKWTLVAEADEMSPVERFPVIAWSFTEERDDGVFGVPIIVGPDGYASNLSGVIGPNRDFELVYEP